ncbi:hypothetical protein E8E11_007486 [Didymella keratinophila]|nr:hypothetical protein E8E11_007486 [Didymella keratinophila]
MVKLGALAFGLLTVVAEVSAQQTVKVMPFGASIVSRCWRANLQAKLRNDKVTNFDFVGSQKSTCDGTNVDQDHEGHPGSQAVDYVANGNLTVWLDQNPPDVILMLLGTNDVLIGKKSTGDVVKAYDTLIGQMRAKNPKIHIIFSNLLPLDTARWPRIAADGIVNLNTAIRQYAPSKSTRDSPVTFVDNFTNFDPVKDTTDGEHPNDAGNEKMATQFFGPTRDAIKAIFGIDAKAKGQAQAVQDQVSTATPTLITSTVQSTAQPESDKLGDKFGDPRGEDQSHTEYFADIVGIELEGTVAFECVEEHTVGDIEGRIKAERAVDVETVRDSRI